MLDLGSRRVVGWATSATNDQVLTATALQRARAATTGTRYAAPLRSRLVVHRRNVQQLLTRHELIGSMSRTGNCWNNAVATEMLGHYIEGWYNPRRRHSSLGYVSPVEYEQQLAVA